NAAEQDRLYDHHPATQHNRTVTYRRCGKHEMHGMNIQVLAAPDGTPLWSSGSLPGSVHDLKAARIWSLIRRLHACELIALADKVYVGAGPRVPVPYKGRSCRSVLRA
ncbi:transposase family protein, partial [Streptosporangium sp. G11]|uniref:transposase family protein n=1 Tax=Streptosporangium sp. G11 TaxID=3436926 RepID=UPI003EB977FA